MSAKLPHLMAPGHIGKLRLRNRIIMSPMGSNTADDDGFCGERLMRYYEARAKGGAAMVIMGSVSIAYPIGSANWRQVAISDDKYLPALTELAALIHSHDCKIAVQLQHAGTTAMNDMKAGREMLTPSVPEEKPDDMQPTLFPDEQAAMMQGIDLATYAVRFHEAEAEDIAWVIDKFAEAAERARRAGIDGVEIHAGHGYLIHSFLNPAVNKRTDSYGGSIENRSRLLVEVIRAVKARCGQDFPVWFRMDGVEFMTEGGITHEDAKQTARLAAAAGADAVHVSAYADASKGESFTTAHAVHKPCGFVDYAAGIKAVVDIPVITPGRIEPQVGDRLIGSGKIDFVTMARKLLADPDLPNKIRDGQMDEIRPCIYCYTCISQIFLNTHVKCAVNARTGREFQTVITPAATPRKIMVVGAGPAGMETARVAALRGHHVSLYDKSTRLGGTVFFSAASYPPNGKLVSYFAGELKRLPVAIHLNTEVTPELVASEEPDAVVVATGARRGLPDVPGIDHPHVLSGDDIRAMITGESDGDGPRLPPVTRTLLKLGSLSGITGRPDWMRQLSRVWMPMGKHVVMIGGGLVAVELAEFLAERGRKVTVLEEGGQFGSGLMMVRRWRNLADCRALGVDLIAHARVVRIDTQSVTYVNESHQERSIRTDQVIVTSGAEANPGLVEQLRGMVGEVHSIGDCNGVGYIDGAVHAGFDLAMRL